MTPGSDQEIVGERTFAASLPRVWAAWTDPAQIVKWWGPNGFTTTIHEMDVRPGGIWQLTMHGPDGTDYWNDSVYVEVAPPERLVFDHVSDPRFRMTVTFSALDGKTVVSTQMVFESARLRSQVDENGAIEGLQQTLSRLEDFLMTE